MSRSVIASAMDWPSSSRVATLVRLMAFTSYLKQETDNDSRAGARVARHVRRAERRAGMAQTKQPQSLDELYNLVGAENTATLKQAATALRRKLKLNLAVILQAHELLAGRGREGKFKQWCQWEKINYGYARVMVCAAKKEQKLQDEGESVRKRNTSNKPPRLKRSLNFADDPDGATEFDKLIEEIVGSDLYTREEAVLAGLLVITDQVNQEIELFSSVAALADQEPRLRASA
jgi:hypothetical protein